MPVFFALSGAEAKTRLLGGAAAQGKGDRSQEIARTRRSQETIFGENSESENSGPFTLTPYPLNPTP